MSGLKKIAKRTARRKLRIKQKLKKGLLPRISVFKSLKHMYVQLIDDQEQKTLVSCSTLDVKNTSGTKQEQAKVIGLEFARRSVEKGIKEACFDRGSFLYHGRIKALADAIREGGIKI